MNLVRKPNDAAALQSRIGDRSDLPRIGAEIDALNARALDANPFYGAAFLAATRHLEEKRALRFAECRMPDGALAGFLPFREALALETGFLPALKAYRNPFILRSEPLLDKTVGLEAAAALITAISTAAGRTRLLLLPFIDLQGATFTALEAAAAVLGRQVKILRFDERAALQSGDSLRSERHKRARRALRKLSEAGRIETRIGIGGAEAADLPGIFLSLEASGWKGRAGTALASSPGTLAFAKEVLDPLKSDIRFDCLMLDGVPIAANANLAAGGHVMTWKSGYDERYRAYSPGFALDALFSEGAAAGLYGNRIDSCAAPGHVLEGLWPSRLRIGLVAIDIASLPDASRFAAACNRFEQFLTLKEKAKTAIARWRGERIS
jgi:hypothetical protein